ncbi:MAG: 5'/3'-nucleotidase SurE [Leptolyngbyaceae cyanobacterium bins.302]|nr:5'/3'-nucleotidase SurE [Leptolyngbyaceae cyanobacterium bins.302]
MVFVLTNDDGIDAPGIQALRQAVQQLGFDAVVVAPQDHLSGCGHQVTTTRTIQVERRSEREFAIAGTPADCVRLAISHLVPDVQWVLSGINAGGNLGSDVYISGTVAAVREAALNQIPGIAFSQYRQGKREIDWDYAAHLVQQVLQHLLEQPVQLGTFWNVNLPHLPPGASNPATVFCLPCKQPLPITYEIRENGFHYAGRYSERRRDPGADVDVCFSGQISITNLHL